MFFYSKGTLGSVFNDLYGILSALGISMFLYAEYKEKGDKLFVPAAILFLTLSLIFGLNSLFDSFYQTYKAILLTISSTMLCYVLLCFR